MEVGWGALPTYLGGLRREAMFSFFVSSTPIAVVMVYLVGAFSYKP